MQPPAAIALHTITPKACNGGSDLFPAGSQEPDRMQAYSGTDAANFGEADSHAPGSWSESESSRVLGVEA